MRKDDNSRVNRIANASIHSSWITNPAERVANPAERVATLQHECFLFELKNVDEAGNDEDLADGVADVLDVELRTLLLCVLEYAQEDAQAC